MLQNPTQMNRALERISPKPMVDGFVKIFDEFRNGCDEKAIQYRHTPPIALIRNSNSFAFEFANLSLEK